MEIELAYRLLLRREADPGGVATYEEMGAAGLTLEGLRDLLLSSPEYRRNYGGEQIVDMGHAKVVADPNEPEFGRHIVHHGIWEPHIVNTIQRSLEPGHTYIDIGANIGITAFTAASAVGPEGTVIAFEPHPDNIRRFLSGVTENAFKNVRLYGFALSDAVSTFSLLGSSNGYLEPSGRTTFETVALPGDDVLDHLSRVDFIKIDIEGHEPQALRGLQQTLSKHRPLVLAEFNPRCLIDHSSYSPETFARDLFRLTDAVQIIENNGGSAKAFTTEELISFWTLKNNEAVSANHLPDGMLHLDLLFRVQ